MRGLRVGQTFRGLLVHSELGAGAMGTAWLASHPVLQKPYVIKVFSVSANPDFFSEAHLAARVRAPEVVDVVDAGVEEGLSFVVQRYVDGIDLARLLESFAALGRRLPMDLVCRIVVDVARGLHAIHQAGVVHRDVKPANLFWEGSGQALVGDFGIAVAAGAGTIPELAGTPDYMAPEQWEIDRPLDRRADVYALGVTTHLLASGRPAFSGTLEQLALAHTTRDYQPPRAEDPREAYLYAVVERMLRKAPEARYPTAEAVASELERIVEPPPTLHVFEADRAACGSLLLHLEVGDLSQTAADVLVNAANTDLVMRLGVARALRLAGGDEIESEAKAQGPVPMGTVVWSGAGRLRARHVAHAVAAISGAVCLQRTTLLALLGAEARGAQSIAFPALGTGVGRVPLEQAAKLMLEAARTFASLDPRHLREVRFVLLDEATRQRWRAVLAAMHEGAWGAGRAAFFPTVAGDDGSLAQTVARTGPPEPAR